MTMYVNCVITECEDKIKEWLKSDDDKLICGFEDVRFSVNVNDDSYYKYGNYCRDFMEMIEEVQMNIRSPDYPENVLISFKNVNKQPKDEKLPVWSEEEIENWGYWYLVAKKL